MSLQLLNSAKLYSPSIPKLQAVTGKLRNGPGWFKSGNSKCSELQMS